MYGQGADVALDEHALTSSAKAFPAVETAEHALADGADIEPVRDHLCAPSATGACWHGNACKPLAPGGKIASSTSMHGRPSLMGYLSRQRWHTKPSAS